MGGSNVCTGCLKCHTDMIVDVIHDQQGRFDFVFNRALVVNAHSHRIFMEVYAVEPDSWLSEFILDGIIELSNPKSKFRLDKSRASQWQTASEQKQSQDTLNNIYENDFRDLTQEEILELEIKAKKLDSFDEIIAEMDHSFLDHFVQQKQIAFLKRKRQLIVKALNVERGDHLVFLQTEQTDQAVEVMHVPVQSSFPEKTFLQDALNPELSLKELVSLGVLSPAPEFNRQARQRKEELVVSDQLLSGHFQGKLQKFFLGQACFTYTISKMTVRPDDFSLSLDMEIKQPFSVFVFGRRNCDQFQGKSFSRFLGEIVWDLVVVGLVAVTKLKFLSIFNYKDLYDLIQVDTVPKHPRLNWIMRLFDVFDCASGFKVDLTSSERVSRHSVQSLFPESLGSPSILTTRLVPSIISEQRTNRA